jgi:hypothetical protein
MSKVLYIIGIVLSVVFLIFCGYYINEVSSARIMSYLDSYSYGSSYDSLYNSLSSYYDNSSDLTSEAGLISLIFFLFFIFADIMGIVKVKTPTMKVLGIIGICISGLFLIWDVLMISSPGSLSFDEVGAGFVFYCFIILAFSIVGLIQSIRYDKQKMSPVRSVGNTTSDLLDS